MKRYVVFDPDDGTELAYVWYPGSNQVHVCESADEPESWFVPCLFEVTVFTIGDPRPPTVDTVEEHVQAWHEAER